MALPVLLLIAVSTPAAEEDTTAADEEKIGWSDEAEFSLVSTSGNSESSTLGFQNKLTRDWETSALVIRAYAIRAKSDTITRFAIGTPGDFSEQETSESEVTAETYYLHGKYDSQIREKLLWYAGGGWARNRPAGIDNRFLVEGGLGNLWRDDDDLKFLTEYAITWTNQENVVTLPDVDETWVGARFRWEYLNKFGASTTYENVLLLDANLEESSRWRGTMLNSVSVSMSSHLALKVSLLWLYENEPAFTDGKLFDPAIPPAPPVPADPPTTVPIQLDELDSIFTASLVVNF
jgi:putative salt-induced outer membrane protein YdiY